VHLKNADDVNAKYNLDGDDKVKTETVQTSYKKRKKASGCILWTYTLCA